MKKFKILVIVLFISLSSTLAYGFWDQSEKIDQAPNPGFLIEPQR